MTWGGYLEKTAPELHNPAYYDEILTARWKDKDFLQFKKLIDEGADIAMSALEEDEHDEAASLWQKILGEDFIFQTDKTGFSGPGGGKVGILVMQSP